MNEEQKRWSDQYSSSVGAKEFLRLSCAVLLWSFILIAISILFALAGYSSSIMNWVFSTILVFSIFICPLIALRSKSGYALLRKILGNENLPKEPYPRSTVKIQREPRPWWSYLPSLWFSLVTLLALYFAIKYLLK